jgi:flagellar protein FliO/FliZ
MRPRDKRLGVVETVVKRKLFLVRRDDVEHLVMIGGPIDMLIETGIKGRPHLEPPLEDVIIAKSEIRPAPDFSKT